MVQIQAAQYLHNKITASQFLSKSHISMTFITSHLCFITSQLPLLFVFHFVTEAWTGALFSVLLYHPDMCLPHNLPMRCCPILFTMCFLSLNWRIHASWDVKRWVERLHALVRLMLGRGYPSGKGLWEGTTEIHPRKCCEWKWCILVNSYALPLKDLFDIQQ